MNDEQFWALAFIQLVCIKAHPRNNAEPNLAYCAHLADDMLEEWRFRKPIDPSDGIKVEESCHSG
jgi:hypothetical protein